MTVSPATNAKWIVGYFPSWAIHAPNYRVPDIPAAKLSHLNYAFADVSATGECISIEPQDDQINFPQLQLLKQRYPGLKTLISVGGASHSSNFSAASSSSASRTSLAQSCVSFMKVSGFDGIDIDWEFPAPADKTNYTALLKELRSQLNTQGLTDSKQYLLTAALPAAPDEYGNFELAQVGQYLDWVNLMAYDFYTPSSLITHFSAPLYVASTDPEPDPKKRSSSNLNAAVQAYLAAGVPANKIVAGVSFFGFGWQGVSNNNNGLYQTASGPAQGTWEANGVFDFEDLSNNYLPNCSRCWSAEACVPWLYSSGAEIMISYDDAQSLGLKANYVNANNLAGMMIWPLSADDSQSSLLNALSAALNPPSGTGPNPSASSQLDNSTRRIPKASYVPLTIPVDDAVGGRAVLKFGYVRQLGLQPGEVNAAQGALPRTASSGTSTPWDVLRSFEGSPMISQLPSPSVFVNIPSSTLLAFGRAVVALRLQALNQLKQQVGGVARPALGSTLASVSGVLGSALNLVNAGTLANNAFEANVTATPIGMLNLERLEMTPAGIERGALLATIPLAPLEQTSVVQKEWSVTSQEFTSIVTDSLENYSETGVTENTELAQSTTAQTQHSNQFNINATVSGGCGFVTGSVSTGFTSQDSNSNSATDSRKHAIDTTRKASARVKQEHKMSISTTTVTGTSESTTRTLQNPSATDPIRIDYFSMMRKWYVALYRYGLRLTYDIAIPEPGGTLREAYMKLADLQTQVSQGFTFPLKYSDITLQTYQDTSSILWTYASQYGAQVPPPPSAPQPLTVGGQVPGLGDDDSWHFNTINFSVPDGCWITDVYLNGLVGIASNHNNNGNHHFIVIGSGYNKLDSNHGYSDDLTVPQYGNFMFQYMGAQVISCFFQWVDTALVQFTIKLAPTDAAMEQWQASVWSALYNAAQSSFYAQQQTINAQIQALQDQINNVDTLTLRREENDEIMKGILRWLLGPSFDFMPPEVVALFGNPAVGTQAYDLLTHGVSFTGNDIFTSDPTLKQANTDWSTMFQYQEMVKFINEAIEWENVLYFLYSYFWDVPVSWDFIRQIRHPDSTRQAFLRAGSSRVVLTVRKGWELAWVSFVEAGGFGQTLIPGHPYLTIAQEIQNYDNTNYPGIPPANPASGPTAGGDNSAATTSSQSVAASTAPVTITVDSSAGFIVGYSAVIDVYVYDANNPNANPQESQTITAVPDATHITVGLLNKAHDGTSTPFPVLQPGEKGVLISQWFEYTPTSGTDIAVTSNLATIA